MREAEAASPECSVIEVIAVCFSTTSQQLKETPGADEDHEMSFKV